MVTWVVPTTHAAPLRDSIPLEGVWNYQLVGASPSIPGEGTINLPSTLDEQHKSEYNPQSDNTTQLRREFSFAGTATYSREINIPQSWQGKSIQLFLERTKPSSLKINGNYVGYNNRISSPQKYDVSDFIKPGLNTIEISVNNDDSIPPIIRRSSNAVSESTQTNWNGILGNIFLEAANPFNIKNVRFQENLADNSIKIISYFSEPAPKNLNLSIVFNGDNYSFPIEKGEKTLEATIPIGKAALWSDGNPILHDFHFSIDDFFGIVYDKRSFTTGLRQLSSGNQNFYLNDEPVFLRGTVNTAIFPLTGYSPVDLDSWMKYFNILKEYGFNHVRFHSWTPPDAAFQAADKLGMIVQTELPIWGELDRDLIFHNRFLKEDLNGILESYSHHPSFALFSVGNELWGDISLMGEYMNAVKNENPRVLATYGSNVYLGMNGRIGDEDFIVASKLGDDPEKSIRGSISFADSPTGGYLNSHRPNSSHDFSNITKFVGVPVIAHEVGQYQSYPDFNEIDKYTGLLKPDNLIEFQNRAVAAGTVDRNEDFAKASGTWAAKLYKAEMEMAHRTPGLSGYQLFGIQDYPGQGTSLVGILDPFMESKDYISAEKWRQSNNGKMILAKFPKFSFYENETVKIPLLYINYDGYLNETPTISWTTDFDSGVVTGFNSSIGQNDASSITLTIPKVNKPVKMTLGLSDSLNSVSNSYDFWIYPRITPDVENVFVTDNLDEAIDLLDKGRRVILFPDSAVSAEASIPGLFVTDFWNYRMFRTICDEMGITPSPGTLGMLIDSAHPSLKSFPTENHTDWQWFPIVTNSHPLVIDRLPQEVKPIIEVIDNVERNFRLALMLECNVGKGKLMIISADLDKTTQSPEGKWFLQSVKEYMAGKDCKPDLSLSKNQVRNLVTKPSVKRFIKELKNETYNSNWE
ncbi:MAG: beta-glycosidase [Muribaculaceae bacterium]|nr:beta-glycosidase [Muribaculaceae bacterium]